MPESIRQIMDMLDARPAPTPDEPESETGARDVAERATAMARLIYLDGPTRDLARLVAQLAAAVACYIEDNERQVADHTQALTMDHARLDALDAACDERMTRHAAAIDCHAELFDRVTRRLDAVTADVINRRQSLERRVSAIEEEAENLNARDRLAALEDEQPEPLADPAITELLDGIHGTNAMGDEVETRSTEWMAGYDAGWTAALDARDHEDDHDRHDCYVAGCEACDEEREADRPATLAENVEAWAGNQDWAPVSWAALTTLGREVLAIAERIGAPR